MDTKFLYRDFFQRYIGTKFLHKDFKEDIRSGLKMLCGSWSSMTVLNKCANKALMVYWAIIGSGIGSSQSDSWQLLLNPLTLKADH
jgi:hypothetical protein